MVINFTNINKTNNHLLHKTIEHKKTATSYGAENQSPGQGQTHKCGGVQPVTEILPLLIIRSPTTLTLYTNNKNKTCTDSLPLNKATHYLSTVKTVCTNNKQFVSRGVGLDRKMLGESFQSCLVKKLNKSSLSYTLICQFALFFFSLPC